MPTKNRGIAVSAAVTGAGDICFGRVLEGRIAKAKAPPLKASSLNARAQKNRLPGLVTAAGKSITKTKISIVIPTNAAANRAFTSTAILSAAQRKPTPVRYTQNVWAGIQLGTRVATFAVRV